MSTHQCNRKRPHRAERDTIAAISDRDEMARSARTLIRGGQPSAGSRARVPHLRGRSAKRTVLIGLLAALFPNAVAADLRIDLVGQWGGPANDAVVVGDLAYVGSGPNLLILDVSQPAEPVLLGHVELPDLVLQIAVSGNLVYVANRTAGLQIIDVSNPNEPFVVGTFQTDESVVAVAVADNYAYLLAAYRAFLVIDVTDPNAPFALGDLRSLRFDLGSVAVSGNYAYVVGSGNFGGDFVIIDVSDPKAPLVVAEERGFYTLDVVVSGPYAYLATIFGLSIVDVSNPSEPLVVGTYWEGRRRTDRASVSLSGSHAYMIRRGLGLDIIDITDPTDPRGVGRHASSEHAVAVFAAPGHAYIAEGPGGVLILDISDPSAPFRAGRYERGGLSQGVAVSGPLAYLADYPNGLQIIDVSDAAAPVRIGRAPTIGVPDDVAVRGRYAYIVARGSGLEIFDISDPSAPAAVGLYETSSDAHGITLRGRYAYVGTVWTVEIIDVTDPANPLLVGTYQGSGARGIVVRGDYAYIVPASTNVFEVLDVSDPSQPFRVGRSHLSTFHTHLDVRGNYAFVAASNFEVIDISEPSNPVPVVRIGNLGGGAQAVTIFRNYAYVSVGFAGLRIFRISDPTNPVLVGSNRTNGRTLDIAVSGGQVYLADASWGLRVFSVALAGDMNCDGAFNGDDIDPFFLALGDPAAYAARFPDCNALNGDFNCDERLGGADIDPFFNCLAGDCRDCNANGIPDYCEVYVAPAITTQPQNTTECAGNPVALRVQTTPRALSYQWRKNGNPIAGATSMRLWFNPVQLEDAGDYDVIVSDACVSLTSDIATLTVRAPPAINTHPQSQTVCLGGPLVLSVVATGRALTYQWRKDRMDIPGATDPTYIVPAVSESDRGAYNVAVANSCKTVWSNQASVTIVTTIFTHPVGQTVCENDPVIFTVLALGQSLTYQWRKDGVDISGATLNFFVINAAAMNDAGIYDVVVTSLECTQTSDPAPLVVQQCP